MQHGDGIDWRNTETEREEGRRGMDRMKLSTLGGELVFPRPSLNMVEQNHYGAVSTVPGSRPP